MNKITIIQLLNKIANGKVPSKIKYDDMIFEYDGGYYSSKNNIILEEYCNLTTSLNDEVEIIEEEKKIPEKIKVKDYDKCIHNVTHKEKEFSLDIRELQITYNDLLDYLKSKGDE